ncbi:MAG TPA: RluA family pseudouridine synthase [Cytophagaceae bacterium]|jgi:RluA family pseudouridine synthase|nr:RluA family pseudouridine synthase [Cytophagaceae bacterium]
MSVKINVSDHILFEDPFILVLNKPSSLMVEPDRNGHPNLLQQVQKYIKTSIYPDKNVYAQHIHRLDRPVSGIVLFAKQKEVLKNLSEQFAERKVKKYYQALTETAPKIGKGKLENGHRKEKKKAVIVDVNAFESETVMLGYEVKQVAENKFLWDIELHTGKFHQIRAQLAAVGCPVIGDHLYGSSAIYKPDSITLHACKLIFLHPITNEEIVIEKENNWRELAFLY